MAFPQNFLDTLLDRNDIVDVVRSYVALKAKGGEYWACCPFHNEKTPSFHVVPDKQMFYCFGCHKGGGVINFIMEEENLTYPDAVRFLARRAGMEIPEERDPEDGAKRARLLRLNRDAARFYYQLLQGSDGEAVRQYLHRRRITKKTAVRFGMGASPDAWDALLNGMTAMGYSKQDLLDAGLIVAGKKGLYDKFRNRLILPVIDERGDVVGFGSRVLDKSEPKYMNSPDTPVYSKQRVLYGLNLAKKSKRGNLILCEGNLDVVTLHQAGFDNAVASMGTALTDRQIRLLSRYTKEVILCYDNDNAGRAATERALRMLNNSEFSVRVLELPQRLNEKGEYVKQDADDFIKFQGANAFERLLSGSAAGMDFRMAQVAAKYDLTSDEGRVGYSTEVQELLASIQSSAERDIYTQRAAEAAGIAKESMMADVSRTAKAQARKERRTEERKALNPVSNTVQPQDRALRYGNPRSARAEEGILRLLLRDSSFFPTQSPLREEDFSMPLYGKAFAVLWRAKAEGHPVSLNLLSGELNPEEMSQIASVCRWPESTANAAQALQDYIHIIRDAAEQTRYHHMTEEEKLKAITEKYKKGHGGKQV